MGGVFDLTTAAHMLEKLRLEVAAYKADVNARHAINAIWTGYHMLEWIWKQRLESNATAQAHVGVCDSGALRTKVSTEYPAFQAIRGVTNGAKHFTQTAATPTTSAHRGAFDSSVFDSKVFDVTRLLVEVDGAQQDVEDVLDGLLAYWEKFFADYL